MEARREKVYPWGIHVVLVVPGSIHTPVGDKLVPESEAMLSTFPPQGARHDTTAYRAFAQAFAKQHQQGAAPPEVMARAVLKALTARTPRTRSPVGPLSRRLPPRVFDRVKTRLFGLLQHVDAGN
jgi:NAD(P)-dependent dehydrogenase (short-subunit alcohol dehydrogenase family)